MYCLLHSCFQTSFHLIKSKIKLKYVCICIGFITLLDFFGVFTHLFETTYDSNFCYPYEGDIHEFVNALRHNEKPIVDPINEYNYTFLIPSQQKCVDAAYNTFHVVYIVKSAIEHFERRLAIRKSWGFEKRFFDVPSRTIFVLGVHPYDDELQAKVKIEAAKYKDIVQIDYIDSYYNNTIKTMMSFRWLVKYCSNSKFYMFVDDDIYVSVKNVLRFIRNPANYPDYLKEPKKVDAHKREIKDSDEEKDLNNDNITQTSTHTLNKKNLSIYEKLKSTFLEDLITQCIKLDSYNKTISTISLVNYSRQNYNTQLKSVKNKSIKSDFTVNREKRQVFDFELPEDVRLFAGFVIVSAPHRHKSSKWYVPLSEYPYHLWPPYVTAGAYILSKEALLDMYYTSLYTQNFRFDDIFLGLVAKKADIELFHCEEFHFYKKDYTKFNYKYVITSHGYENPNELLYVWNEQKALGNA
ncbi:PREDICTED: beta-1,3-galactosyltransferase brn [Eufriesea mexicana]|uniref:beta-1,3-galactosyltransferase brn n=1 Tax=Eufriesea mexicana TaxID=516756 RepID=UPI00083C1C27|nr:PREDICTED: beta-1,3-galactosyltransferase brn [Eufriesea mexicana]